MPPDEAGRRPLKPRFKATFHTHIKLWAAAQHYRWLARQDTRGAWYLDLATMLFAHLTVEAYANSLGAAIDPETWAREREEFRGGGAVRKVKHLARLCALRLDKGGRPLKTVCMLQVLRDELSHGRPENTEGPLPSNDPFDITSSLSKTVSSAAADRALEDAEAVMERLHEAARMKYPHHRLNKIALGSITEEATIVGGR